MFRTSFFFFVLILFVPEHVQHSRLFILLHRFSNMPFKGVCLGFVFGGGSGFVVWLTGHVRCTLFRRTTHMFHVLQLNSPVGTALCRFQAANRRDSNTINARRKVQFFRRFGIASPTAGSGHGLESY